MDSVCEEFNVLYDYGADISGGIDSRIDALLKARNTGHWTFRFPSKRVKKLKLVRLPKVYSSTQWKRLSQIFDIVSQTEYKPAPSESLNEMVKFVESLEEAALETWYPERMHAYEYM